MSTYFDTVIAQTAAILDEHRVDHRVYAGGLNVSFGRGARSRRIGDIAGIIAGFRHLHTAPDLVANALAAHALGMLDIKHSIPLAGLTIALNTPKSKIPIQRSGYPMNMLRGR